MTLGLIFLGLYTESAEQAPGAKGRGDAVGGPRTAPCLPMLARPVFPVKNPAHSPPSSGPDVPGGPGVPAPHTQPPPAPPAG